MAVYYSDPIVVKKYIKIPDRRLISGFLTVNVIHHDDNDALPDAMEYYYTNWSGQSTSLKLSTPFRNNEPTDPGRTNYKHTFGDYDCFLFWVAGGMTLQAPTFSTTMNQSTAATQNYVHDATGHTTWEDDRGSPNDQADFSGETWYDDLLHPCQNFVKYHLVGRINNGYGHTDTDHMKINPIRTDTFEIDDGADASFASDSAIATPTNAFDARKGMWSRYIISNGSYSNDGDGIVDLSSPAANTYFPMVENIEIYGKHNFLVPYHTSSDTGSGSPGTIYSSSNTTVGNYVHETSFWSLVIKISIRGYNHEHSAGGSDGLAQSTKEFFKSRTNVFFQPFGETSTFNIADSLHTS